jgi:hypothetical protein
VTRNLGERRGLWSFERLALAVGLIVIVAGAAAGLIQFRDQRIAEAKAWAITGAPCPELSRAAFHAFGAPPTQVFDYDGLVLGRAHGDAICSDIAYGGGVGLTTYPECQFNRPEVVELVMDRRMFFFAPGAGRPATLSIPHGKPRCVMNATVDFDG